MPPMRPKKGRFIDGVWHCNCDPRLPASHFQVKRDSANKGRWFYCCTNPKETQCGFFLWEEDAKLREEQTLLANGRTEMLVVDVAPQEPETPRRERMGRMAGWLDESPQTPMNLQRSTVYPTPGESRVRKERSSEMALVQERSSPTYKYDSLSGYGDDYDAKESGRESFMIADTATRKRKRDIEPESDSSKTEKLGSPPSAHRRSTTNDLVKPEVGIERYATPSTVRRLDFGTPSTARAPNTPSNGSIFKTPSSATPGRITSTPDEDGNYDITSSVLSALQKSAIPLSARQLVQQTLNSYALRVSGIERGRDITRLALKKKEEKIAELEQKIQQLEQERDLDKTIINHFKKDMVDSAATMRRIKEDEAVGPLGRARE